jgi:transcriptional antiterminator NusG|tara:strand:+ start:1798 stop:2349 length:552 start_codon:yes stop_codon:yes gene_type:complete
MSKDWFVVHTLTGQEYKAKESIERRLEAEEMTAYVDEVIVPTEKVSEVRGGVRSTSTRKYFPGYVMVNMSLYNDENEMNEKTWYFIRDTPGIIGFIGGDRPAPLQSHEVEALMNQIEDRKDTLKPKVSFEPGDTVKITDGPFLNFNGAVEEVDPDRGKLKVSVAIFGRTTPVELEYWQVERQA